MERYKEATSVFKRVLAYIKPSPRNRIDLKEISEVEDEFEFEDEDDMNELDAMASEPEPMQIDEIQPSSEEVSPAPRVLRSSDDETPASAETSMTSQSPELEVEEKEIVVEQARRKSSVAFTYAAAFEYPKFRYEGWEPPLPVSTEREALEAIKAEWERNDSNGDNNHTIICDLQDFAIYLPSWRKHHAYEMRTLDALSRPSANELMLSGILTIGSVRHYVQDVAFTRFSLEGYGRDDSPEITLYIQSFLAGKEKSFDIWYRLGQPVSEYKIYWRPFLWVASFTKHVIDYLDETDRSVRSDAAEAETTKQVPRSIRLWDFKTDFNGWLANRFPQDAAFQRWKKAFGNTDFRSAFHANGDFLWHQAADYGDKATRDARLRQPVWNDCGFNMDTLELEKIPVICTKTIATPFVYDCFSHLYFGCKLEQVIPVDAVYEAQTKRKAELGFARDRLFRGQMPRKRVQLKPRTKSSRPVNVQIGDVISVPADEETKWKREGIYYAYVQGIRRKQTHDELTVVWLYTPEETTIHWSRYTFTKEIFFSNHCNCEHPTKIKSTEVLSKHSVEWFPQDVETKSEFFVRQKYLKDGSGFVSLSQNGLKCECEHNTTWNFKPNDTVYVTQNLSSPYKSARLDPVIIVKDDKLQRRVIVRRLLRTKQDCGHLIISKRRCPKNELTWSDELFAVSYNRIDRKCHIKAFTQDELQSLPFPYNREGRWDFWYIATRLTSEGGEQRLVPIPQPLSLNHGLDLSIPPTKPPLSGLSLFSGGGSFDRGLEAGGAIEFKHTVDFCEWAVLTQRANSDPSSDRHHIQSSVDDVLKAAILDSDPARVPRIGYVRFVNAGSPCPGFSSLQTNKLSEESLRNSSHITTIVSYVDVYRPEYAILENVVNVVDKLKGYERQSVFSQLIGALVAMGYQTTYWVENAWQDGSCQRRPRMFMAIAAPGLKPIAAPEPTHRGPTLDDMNRPKMRGLGELPCGTRFGHRDPDDPVPFLKHVSAKEAVEDLPDLGSATSRICVRYPDHRVSEDPSEKHRAIVKHIPTFPYRSDYAYALKHGLLPASLVEQRSEVGRSFQRIHPDGLMPTITTKTNYRCSRSGNIIHYQQHRPLTIREAARVQGWDDNEVIIGARDQQYKIIGNGVDRNMSTAHGFLFREAWENSTGFDPRNFERQSSPHDYELIDIEEEAENNNEGSGGESIEDATLNGQMDDMPGPDGQNTTLKRSDPVRSDNPNRHGPRVVIPAKPVQKKSIARVVAKVRVERKDPIAELDALSSNRKRTYESLAIRSGPPPQAKRTRGAFRAEAIDLTRSTQSEGRKSSRSSGATVDFASVSWDKMPETVAKRQKRDDSYRD